MSEARREVGTWQMGRVGLRVASGVTEGLWGVISLPLASTPSSDEDDSGLD